MRANTLFLHKPSAPGVRSKGHFFSERSYLAYKIKGNGAPHKHINMYLHTPVAPIGFGQKGKAFFLKVVMFHIKLNEMDYRVPQKHIFCLYTHTRSLGLCQKVKTWFHIQILSK